MKKTNNKNRPRTSRVMREVVAGATKVIEAAAAATAKPTQQYPSTVDDATLLASARSAFAEAEGNFTRVHQLAEMTAGCLEMMRHMVCDQNLNGPSEDVDWVRIATLLDHVTKQFTPVEATLYSLAGFERDARDAQARA